MGNPFVACNGLGNFEENNNNLSEAKRWYEKSCDLGDMQGCVRLGYLEEKEGDLAGARELYKKSCDQGNVEGCANWEYWTSLEEND